MFSLSDLRNAGIIDSCEPTCVAKKAFPYGSLHATVNEDLHGRDLRNIVPGARHDARSVRRKLKQLAAGARKHREDHSFDRFGKSKDRIVAPFSLGCLPFSLATSDSHSTVLCLVPFCIVHIHFFLLHSSVSFGEASSCRS